jgi:Bacterial PH domain
VTLDRKRYRSTGQCVGLAGFAVFLAALGTDGALRDHSTIEAVLINCIAVFLLVISARVGLWTTRQGIVIRNLVSTTSIRWSQIRAFRIGRYRLLGAVCIVDLHDGSSRHAFGIQVPHYALNRPASNERVMVAHLNDRLYTERPDLLAQARPRPGSWAPLPLN